MTYLHPLLLICFVAILVGVVRLHRSRGQKPAFAYFGVAFLLAISWPPLEWLFAQSLECWYRPGPPPASVEAFVIIASSAEFANDELPFDILGHDTYRRCLRVAWLYNNWGRRPVVVSGGPIAKTMGHVLQTQGISPGDIYVESLSTNTYTNALYSAGVLNAKNITRIALVADARDLPRAVRCFARQKLAVTPYPASFRRFTFGAQEWMPGWEAIRSNEHTLHELVGLVWYRIRGWI